jgi:hypothetical protein
MTSFLKTGLVTEPLKQSISETITQQVGGKMLIIAACRLI